MGVWVKNETDVFVLCHAKEVENENAFREEVFAWVFRLFGGA